MARNPDGSYDRDSMRRIVRQGRAQQREQRSADRFTAQNQPRDAEERRNAAAEDKHLAANFNAIVNSVSKMDDQQFDRYLSRNRRKVRKAGGRAKVRRARKAKRGCLVVAFVVCGAVAAVLYGGHELVVSLAIAVPFLPHPAGRHSRTGPAALGDTVRHVLMRIVLGRLDPDDHFGRWTLGITEREVRRREWHATAVALGDLVDKVAAYLAVVVCAALTLPVVVVAVLAAPWWLSLAVLGTAVVALLVWQLVLAARRLHVIVEELEYEEQGL